MMREDKQIMSDFKLVDIVVKREDERVTENKWKMKRKMGNAFRLNDNL